MGKQFLGSIVLLAAVIGIVGCGGNVPAPTSYSPYNAKDGSFQCEYPAEWEAAGGSSGASEPEAGGTAGP